MGTISFREGPDTNCECLKMFTANIIYLKFLIMKNLQNLKGAKALSKQEQQNINGGGHNTCYPYYDYNTCESICQGECKNFVGTNCYACFEQIE
jgi:hypothetical protein